MYFFVSVHKMFWTGVILGSSFVRILSEDLGISEVLRRICAVPSRTVFCSWLGDILSRLIVLKCFLRSLGIAPNDPITTGTTVACFSHSLSISIFRSWYLLIFSSYFSSMLPSPGIATSVIHTRFFSTTVMSGMLCAMCLSVCILKSRES